MIDKLIEKAGAIIWDWNGTLLDDLDVCIGAINGMLEKRSLKPLTRQRYREIFTFPVRDYYFEAGFDFEKDDWETAAMEFIDHYRKSVRNSLLHPEAVTILERLDVMKKRQFILSAMEQDFLSETIRARLNSGIFEKIVGLNNHYAATKAENAVLLVEEIGLPINEIVMIGDTMHDFEVAEKAGIPCILVANGHQARHRLEKTGVPVISDLKELML
jgi:phosphoglycolate phosphatase